MAQVIEPLYSEKRLTGYLTEDVKRVLLIFWHGVGDVVMFINPFRRLRSLYPGIQFDVAFAEGLTQEVLIPGALTVTGDQLKTLEEQPYDIVAKIHFPMSEGQTEFTKGEWCCIHELGIDPVNGHGELPYFENRLVGVHFNITCLPESANPDEETARKVWNEIREAGFVPMETHYQHCFHNPVNRKFDFVDCTVRGCKAEVASLVSLIRSCGHFIGVVSGNFHVAMAVLSPDKVMLLEKDLRLECFTKLPVTKASIRPGEYVEGSVKNWLLGGKV